MQFQNFGPLAPVSRLTLGGGGLGMVWGTTSFDECVATVHDAIAAGITLLDLAPRYGDGKAEDVVGAALGGKLPAGVRVTSKCILGNLPPVDIEGTLRRSIEGSLQRLKLSRIDLFLLHSNIVPDLAFIAARPGSEIRLMPYKLFVDHVRPIFETLVAEGLIGAWGITGIGHPDTIIKLLGEAPKPAAVQIIANLLDSPGARKFFDGPAKPRSIMAVARANNVGIMGIRAVQAGALTAAIDRPLPPDHADAKDFARAAGFRALCAKHTTNPAIPAHRYALSLPIDTLVLGVKNRQELADCIAAETAGPLTPAEMAEIDATIPSGTQS